MHDEIRMLIMVHCLPPIKNLLSKTIMLLEAIDLPIVLISAVQFQSTGKQ